MIQELNRNLRGALDNLTGISDKMRTLTRTAGDAAGSLKQFDAATGALDAVKETASDLVAVFGNASTAAEKMNTLSKSVDGTVTALQNFGDASGVLEKFAAGQELAKNAVRLSSGALATYNAVKSTAMALNTAYQGILAKVTAARRKYIEAVTTSTAVKTTNTATDKKATASANLLTRAKDALSRKAIKNTIVTAKNTIATKAQTIAEKAKTKAINVQKAALAKQKAIMTKLKSVKLKDVIATKAQTIAQSAKAIVIGVATAAKAIFNAVVKANPIAALIAIVLAAVAAIGRLINAFRRSRQATTENGESIDDLAESYGRSTDEIREDMRRMGTDNLDVWKAQENGIRHLAAEMGMSTDEIRANMQRMGITCIDVWESQQNSIQDLSSVWGISADQIRDEIAAMVEELGSHEAALAAWESQQMDMLQGVADEWGMCADKVLTQMGEMGIGADEWSSKMGAAWDNFNSEVASNVNSIVNSFRKIPQEYGQSAEDLRKIMQANIATTEQWRDNMTKIAGEVSPEMLAFLESKGPEFNSVIAEMLESEYELAAWVKTFDNATELGMMQALDNLDCPMIADAIVSRLDDAGKAAANSTALPDGYKAAIERANKVGAKAAKKGGEESGEAFSAGVESGLEKVNFTPVIDELDRATREMASATDNAMDKIGDIFQSGMQSAKRIMDSALLAMDNRVHVRMTTISANIDIGINRIVTAFNGLQSRLRTSGFNAMQGFHEGLLDMEGSIRATARRIVNIVPNAARRSLEINSPSRVMKKLGRGTMGGFAQGMERMQRRVHQVVQDTTRIVQLGIDGVLSESKISNKLTLAIAPPDSTRQHHLMEKLIAAVEAGQNIVLDSGELVGATYPHFDNAAGEAVVYNSRWGR